MKKEKALKNQGLEFREDISVRGGVYDRKGCTYSTYESIRGMNIRKPERICGEAVCSFRFLCYRKLLCYANGREI